MSLNDVLLGKDTGDLGGGKPKSAAEVDPYRMQGATPPPQLVPCPLCNTKVAGLEQTPEGSRCSPCALAYYRSQANIHHLIQQPTGMSFGTRVLIRVVIGIVVAIVMAAIRMH